jgi:hypothetical protein
MVRLAGTRVIPLAFLTALLVVPGASAGQAPSGTRWEPVDPAECVVEPMPPEDQRRLLEAGLAAEMERAATSAPATPAATPSGEPLMTEPTAERVLAGLALYPPG